MLDPAIDVAKLFSPGDPHHYRAALPAYCTGCEHSATCAGGCGAAALWVKGDHASVDPFVAWDDSSPAPRRRLALIA